MFATREHGRDERPLVALGIVALDRVERRVAIGAAHRVQIIAEHDYGHAESLRVHRGHAGPSIRDRVIFVHNVETRDAILAAHRVQVIVHDGHAHARATTGRGSHVREPLIERWIVAFRVVQIGRTVVSTLGKTKSLNTKQ